MQNGLEAWSHYIAITDHSKAVTVGQRGLMKSRIGGPAHIITSCLERKELVPRAGGGRIGHPERWLAGLLRRDPGALDWWLLVHSYFHLDRAAMTK